MSRIPSFEAISGRRGSSEVPYLPWNSSEGHSPPYLADGRTAEPVEPPYHPLDHQTGPKSDFFYPHTANSGDYHAIYGDW